MLTSPRIQPRAESCDTPATLRVDLNSDARQLARPAASRGTARTPGARVLARVLDTALTNDSRDFEAKLSYGSEDEGRSDFSTRNTLQ